MRRPAGDRNDGSPPTTWVQADAAGIAYAIERDWLIIISGSLHSVSLTEVGRRRVKATKLKLKDAKNRSKRTSSRNAGFA
jgi:hypothetical protein